MLWCWYEEDFKMDVLLQSSVLICCCWGGGNVTAIISSLPKHYTKSEGNIYWILLQKILMYPLLTNMNTDSDDDNDWLLFCVNYLYCFSSQFWFLWWPQHKNCEKLHSLFCCTIFWEDVKYEEKKNKMDLVVVRGSSHIDWLLNKKSLLP